MAVHYDGEPEDKNRWLLGCCMKRLNDALELLEQVEDLDTHIAQGRIMTARLQVRTLQDKVEDT